MRIAEEIPLKASDCLASSVFGLFIIEIALLMQFSDELCRLLKLPSLTSFQSMICILVVFLLLSFVFVCADYRFIGLLSHENGQWQNEPVSIEWPGQMLSSRIRINLFAPRSLKWKPEIFFPMEWKWCNQQSADYAKSKILIIDPKSEQRVHNSAAVIG